MRILPVEDDRRVASFIQRGLEEEGYAVDVVHEGLEAGASAQVVDYEDNMIARLISDHVRAVS